MVPNTQHTELLTNCSKCRDYLQNKNVRSPVSQQSNLNKYHALASRFTMLFLCVGMVLLVFFDWTSTLRLIPVPVSIYVRALLLIVFSIYLIKTGLQWWKFNFYFGSILAFFAILNLSYASVSPDPIINLFYSSRILFWLLGTVVAYRLTLSGILSEKVLHNTIVATVIIGAAFTIYFMTRSDTSAGQNASAYLLLWCLPLLLLTEKSRLRNIALAMAVLAILLTIKRGAMIALVISFMAYGLTYLKINGNLRSIIKITRVILLLAIIGAFAVSTNWDAVQTRFQDTSASGRDRLYSMLVNHWIHGEPTNIVFGFGLNSVKKYTAYMYRDSLGIYAHSDWLQYMHDFGLLGLGFLMWLHIKFLKFIRASYKRGHPYTPSLVMGYVILFLANIYSGHLMSPDAIYFGLLIAYSTAAIQYKQKPAIIHKSNFTIKKRRFFLSV